MSATEVSSPAPASSLQVHEDLLHGARLARALAAIHCRAPGQPRCEWYHASLPTLRLLGTVDSPGCDDGFLVPAMRRELAAGARRVLVSGCADAAMLARVAAAFAPAGAPTLVVLDRCRTPLESCRDYARRHGFAVELVHGDILDFEAEPFDLVCTHSFFNFFDAAGRAALARRWRSLLAPGGCVVTAQRVRAGDARTELGYDRAEAGAFADDAAGRACASEAQFGIGADEARALAAAWTREYRAYVIGSDAELRGLFADAGLALEHFQPAPGRDDRPGTPRRHAGTRRLIVARAPAESRP